MSRNFQHRPRGTTSDANQYPIGVHNNYNYGKCETPYRSDKLNDDLTSFSDGFTDTYYEYYNIEERQDVEYYSDGSGSTRLPYYESISLKRHSRNTNGSHESYCNKHNNKQKDVRRVYPNYLDRYCPENVRYVIDAPVANTPRQVVPEQQQQQTERCVSVQSSAVTSVIVDGCGGHCQTFENVCYYFLQVAFTMGILIGTSLSLAGALLRKSAARNVQVLVYIGALLSIVSALLLGVQRNARNNAKKRKQALRNSKAAPIQMDVLTTNVALQRQQQQQQQQQQQHQHQQRQMQLNQLQLHKKHSHQQLQQQPLMMGDKTQRSVPKTVVPVPSNLLCVQSNVEVLDQSGVPWWRRKDLTG